MIHSDADREARSSGPGAGWPARATARMPGASTARLAVITRCDATGDDEVRRQGEHDRAAPTATNADAGEEPQHQAGIRGHQPGADRGRRRSARRAAAARRRRRRSPGPARRGRTPARRAAPASDTKPMSEAARNGSEYQIRRRRLDLPDHAPALGERRRVLLGGDRASATRPWPGAPGRRGPARAAAARAPRRSTVGMAKTKNGSRQPKA